MAQADAWYRVPLKFVGLLALADLDIVAQSTALNGNSKWTDPMILCPGQHRQHNAVRLNDGEFPACAAMTTGYVFRIENPATVFYLQSVGKTGMLTNISISRPDSKSLADASTLHLGSAASIVAFASLSSFGDWWAVSYLLALALLRCINTVIIRSQARADWHGQSEPGQMGDLFVLLSYDRWVRIRGEVDDLKAVTSGRWLHRPTGFQSTMSGLATLLAYMVPALAANATCRGQIIIACMLIYNAALLGAANHRTTALHMKGRDLTVEGECKAYDRRRVLADELIAESGRTDWAIAMGLIPDQSHRQGIVTM
jgi:hypothetical protein